MPNLCFSMEKAVPIRKATFFRTYSIFLREELAGNNPVLMTAHKRAADMEEQLAFGRVGMQENLLLHVGIGRCELMALGTAKDMRLVFQPEINTRTVFGMLDS